MKVPGFIELTARNPDPANIVRKKFSIRASLIQTVTSDGNHAAVVVLYPGAKLEVVAVAESYGDCLTILQNAAD